MYYPIYIKIAGQNCLVAGGGAVAERKVKALLKFQAKVIVVAPRLSTGLLKLSKQKKIRTIKRRFKATDVNQACLVIGATDDRKVNQLISRSARKKNIPVNIVDDPELCSFIVPSIIKRGPLVCAISTSGQAPAFAKAMRLRLEKVVTPAHGRLTKKLGQLRKKRRQAK